MFAVYHRFTLEIPNSKLINLGKLQEVLMSTHVPLLVLESGLAHLRYEAGEGVADTVLVHEVLGLDVVFGLANVASALVEGATEGAAIDLLGRGDGWRGHR